MTDNQESFIIESSQNMKKNDKESFIGTGQNLKDEESSITTDITDALEMDVEMDMDMKKKEDESFGTEKNLKDEESSITTDITDALEMDVKWDMMNRSVTYIFFSLYFSYIFYCLSKRRNLSLVMVLVAIITLCCVYYGPLSRNTTPALHLHLFCLCALCCLEVGYFLFTHTDGGGKPLVTYGNDHQHHRTKRLM